MFVGRKHLEWCAADRRRCTLDEHRSDPIAIRRSYGGLVLTGVRNGDRDYLEVRGSIRLDHGSDEIRTLAAAMDVAVLAVKSGDFAPLASMLADLTVDGHR